MKFLTSMLGIFGVGMMLVGLTVTSLFGFDDPLPDPDPDPDEAIPVVTYMDKKCVTMLDPKQCKDTGNSFCNVFDFEGCDGQACESCVSTSMVANKVCMEFTGESCTRISQVSQNCWGAGVGRRSGTCEFIEATGKCYCNDADDGPCENGSAWFIPCSS